mmetsp:Transcript_20735/g.27302  ORF Transcript_20735/g.27302 Transcript_20735/m.27302 type:complete len:212 (-) Transcript_20735:3573-4208(-)
MTPPIRPMVTRLGITLHCGRHLQTQRLPIQLPVLGKCSLAFMEILTAIILSGCTPRTGISLLLDGIRIWTLWSFAQTVCLWVLASSKNSNALAILTRFPNRRKIQKRNLKKRERKSLPLKHVKNTTQGLEQEERRCAGNKQKKRGLLLRFSQKATLMPLQNLQVMLSLKKGKKKAKGREKIWNQAQNQLKLKLRASPRQKPELRRRTLLIC